MPPPWWTLNRLSQIRPLDTFDVKKLDQLGSVFATMGAANLMPNNSTIAILGRRIAILFGFQAIDCRQSTEHFFYLKILATVLKVHCIEAAEVILTAALVKLGYNPTRLIVVAQNVIQANFKCRIDCFNGSNTALDFLHTLIKTLLLNLRNLLIKRYLTGFLMLLCKKHNCLQLIVRETGEVEGHWSVGCRRQWCAVE